jgi:hypothetical protein
MELPFGPWGNSLNQDLHMLAEAHVALTTNLEDEDCKRKFSMLTPLRGAQPIIKFWIRQQ